MLEITGKCCGGIEAIEFMESLADVIDEDEKTEEFCEKYQAALNRFRYEVAKGVGRKKKIIKAVKSHISNLEYCGKCGFRADEPSHKYCPNCGTRYLLGGKGGLVWLMQKKRMCLFQKRNDRSETELTKLSTPFLTRDHSFSLIQIR